MNKFLFLLMIMFVTTNWTTAALFECDLNTSQIGEPRKPYPGQEPNLYYFQSYHATDETSGYRVSRSTDFEDKKTEYCENVQADKVNLNTFEATCNLRMCNQQYCDFMLNAPEGIFEFFVPPGNSIGSGGYRRMTCRNIE